MLLIRILPFLYGLMHGGGGVCFESKQGQTGCSIDVKDSPNLSVYRAKSV